VIFPISGILLGARSLDISYPNAEVLINYNYLSARNYFAPNYQINRLSRRLGQLDDSSRMELQNLSNKHPGAPKFDNYFNWNIED
jgi:hypothetical protein